MSVGVLQLAKETSFHSSGNVLVFYAQINKSRVESVTMCVVVMLNVTVEITL